MGGACRGNVLRGGWGGEARRLGGCAPAVLVKVTTRPHRAPAHHRQRPQLRPARLQRPRESKQRPLPVPVPLAPAAPAAQPQLAQRRLGREGLQHLCHARRERLRPRPRHGADYARAAGGVCEGPADVRGYVRGRAADGRLGFPHVPTRCLCRLLPSGFNCGVEVVSKVAELYNTDGEVKRVDGARGERAAEARCEGREAELRRRGLAVVSRGDGRAHPPQAGEREQRGGGVRPGAADGHVGVPQGRAAGAKLLGVCCASEDDSPVPGPQGVQQGEKALRRHHGEQGSVAVPQGDAFTGGGRDVEAAELPRGSPGKREHKLIGNNRPARSPRELDMRPEGWVREP